jgi:hypothetical protein
MIRVKRKTAASASIAALLLLAAAALPAQERGREQAPQKKLKEEKLPPKKATDAGDPMRILRRIERAWRNENADAIASHAGRGKVHLDVRGMGRSGGYFSKSQLKYLLRNLFENDEQLKFEFVKFHNLESKDGKVYGIAYRRCKNARSGKVFQDKVYITLDREGPAWVVAEIKTTR